jgi:hypothetical protein
MSLVSADVFPSAPKCPSSDIFSLTIDAMQGVVYKNDSHIVSLFTTKTFDNHGGCNGRISIEVTTQAENHESDHDDNSEEEVIVLVADDDDDEDDNHHE